MERHANYALVGIATLLLFVGLVVFVVWLARVEYGQEYDLYDIVFVGPIQGLTQGGDVDFNGIKVGEVVKIRLDAADPRRVVARARVTSDVPIRKDSYATLEPQGLTGVNYVQITAGSVNQPLLKNTVPLGVIPEIQTRNNVLTSLLEGGNTILSSTAQALDRVNRLMSDQNLKNISQSFGDIAAVTAELRQRKEVIADADHALKSVDAAAQSIKQLSDNGNQLLMGDGKRSLHDVADAAGELKATSAKAHELLDKLEGPTSQFAATGLPQLTQAIVSLQQAADSWNRVALEAQRSPRAFLAKPPAQQVEVKP